MDWEEILTKTQQTTITPKELRGATINLNGRPSASGFWELCFMIENSKTETLKEENSYILETLSKYSRTFQGALMGLGHLCHRIHIDLKESLFDNANLPESPYALAHVFNLFSETEVEFPFSKLLNLLSFPDILIQRNAGRLLAKRHPEIVSEVIEALGLDQPVLHIEERKEFEGPPIILKRGLVAFLRYTKASKESVIPQLIKILEADVSIPGQKSLNAEIELLLAKDLKIEPEMYHTFNLIDVAIKLLNQKSLTPEFLQSLLSAFGLFAARSLIPSLIERMDEFNSIERELLQVITPFIIFVPQIIKPLVEKLVEKCSTRLFDRQLFELTAAVFGVQAPYIHLDLGNYLSLLKMTSFSKQIIPSIQSLIEPRNPAPLIELKTAISVDASRTASVATQVHTTFASVEVQLENLIPLNESII